jgi:hypothetical protein
VLPTPPGPAVGGKAGVGGPPEVDRLDGGTRRAQPVHFRGGPVG